MEKLCFSYFQPSPLILIFLEFFTVVSAMFYVPITYCILVNIFKIIYWNKFKIEVLFWQCYVNYQNIEQQSYFEKITIIFYFLKILVKLICCWMLTTQFATAECSHNIKFKLFLFWYILGLQQQQQQQFQRTQNYDKYFKFKFLKIVDWQQIQVHLYRSIAKPVKSHFVHIPKNITVKPNLHQYRIHQGRGHILRSYVFDLLRS
eukprot:TRINITY_DN2057_c0_g2_i3.p2 TRINITY_DN2057_c0_g2~~TRINITY_DN2057_c0_g2_i3.p2  ORF type:complete len:204 (+),score=-10.42 TRINITY_DN2057_c0_g2_i3:385-996(+)